MDYIYHYNSPIGGITMAGRETVDGGDVLTGLWFDGQKYFGSTIDARHEEGHLPVFDSTCLWLDQYFDGRSPGFMPPIHMWATHFRREVYEILMTIPFGQTMTYGEIAERIAGKHSILRMSARAVGGAVAHNPFSLIIPCHRVIGADKKLTGYAAGPEKKEWLLKHEKKNCLYKYRET